MNLIAQCYASGGDELVTTLEATYEGAPGPYLACAGFQDRTCTTEDGRTLTFTAMGIEEALPKNDNSAFQSLIIAMDNVTGDVQEVVETAKQADKRITVTLRIYLASDLSYPSEKYRMTVLSREYEGGVAKLTCGFFDLLNTNGLRNVLTTLLAPGLKYI